MKLADLCALGIDASLDGHGGLLLDAPKGVLVPGLVERIRHAKPALVAEIMGKCEVGEHGELGSSMFTPGGKGMPPAGHVHTGIPAPRWRVTLPGRAPSPPACITCAHLRRPGMSPGYCNGGRDDLPLAYGRNHPLRKLPADGGERCNAFAWRRTLAPFIPQTENQTEPPTTHSDKDYEVMALTLSHDPAAEFELPPAGATAARCCSVIDLGTQESTYQGEIRQRPKILLSFELAELRSDGTPHRVSRRLTASLNPKAQLRAFLEQWRGRAFTDEELRAFNVGKLINAPCLLNLAHVERAGKQYANILSISPMPKGMTAPELQDAGVLFDLAAPDWQVFAGFSSKLQETIASSPEYAAVAHAAPRTVSTPAPAPAPTSAPPAHSQQAAATAAPADPFDIGDDIPF